MPLEATMMVIDNSEYMRNGDFPPTRFDAMADALHIVSTTKTDSNPENSVGLMTAAGKGPEVLVTHTRELGHIIQGAHDAKSKMGGVIDIPTAINVAQLALKHRQNKNLRQRIILFIGSPPADSGLDEKILSRLAKKLKKNNIALDVVAFGDGVEDDTTLMKTLVDGVNSSDNSHYISITPDPRRLLSDVILSSAVLSSDRGDRDQQMADITDSAGISGPGSFEEYGGIDPNIDPELAMVMRMSMEEERARQRALQQAAESSNPKIDKEGNNPSPKTGPTATSLSISGESSAIENTEPSKQLSEARHEDEDVEMGDQRKSNLSNSDNTPDEDEEAEIARAIEMSMQPPQ